MLINNIYLHNIAHIIRQIILRFKYLRFVYIPTTKRSLSQISKLIENPFGKYLHYILSP